MILDVAPISVDLDFDGYASMPLSAAEQTLANMGKLWSNRGGTSI
jgi:hypothetical protein